MTELIGWSVLGCAESPLVDRRLEINRQFPLCFISFGLQLLQAGFPWNPFASAPRVVYAFLR